MYDPLFIDEPPERTSPRVVAATKSLPVRKERAGLQLAPIIIPENVSVPLEQDDDSSERSPESNEGENVSTLEGIKTSSTHIPDSESIDLPTLVYGFSDGGYVEDSKMAAGWWLSMNNVVVHAKGKRVIWKSPSNNVAEYFGLIHALEAALDRGFTRLAMNMDSLLVVQHVLGLWKCKNPVLIELLQYVRALADQFVYFTIRHTLRGGNTVADALCNKAFEDFTGSNREWYNTIDRLTAGLEVKTVE